MPKPDGRAVTESMPTPEPTSSASVPMAFDPAEAEARVAGDRELLRELVDIFVREAPGMLEKIERALAAGDAPAAHDGAHRLKGATSALAAITATPLADKIESFTEEGNIPAAAGLAGTLRTETFRLMKDLQSFVQGKATS
jgi:two-component system sensor histidine kinase/response regulator